MEPAEKGDANMLTFQQVSKAALIASLEDHRTADRIAQGVYWSAGRGCHIGCCVHDFAPGQENNLQIAQDLFGWPAVLVRLQEVIFENMLDGHYQDWSLRVAHATPEGVDLTSVVDEWYLWLLAGDGSPLQKWHSEKHIKAVALLYQQRLDGREPPPTAWAAARDAAWDAARAAAWAAARDAARAAAWAAARAAARDAAWDAAWDAAGAAARDAARAAAWAAARDAAYVNMGDKLIEIIQSKQETP